MNFGVIKNEREEKEQVIKKDIINTINKRRLCPQRVGRVKESVLASSMKCQCQFHPLDLVS